MGRSFRARALSRSRAVSRPCLSSSGNLEIRVDAEVIARPDAVHGVVEDPLARGDLECRPAVLPAADKNVVDPPKRPVPVGDERIVGREGLARLAGMHALPRVAVTDARAVQGLMP